MIMWLVKSEFILLFNLNNISYAPINCPNHEFEIAKYFVLNKLPSTSYCGTVCATIVYDYYWSDWKIFCYENQSWKIRASRKKTSLTEELSNLILRILRCFLVIPYFTVCNLFSLFCWKILNPPNLYRFSYL